MFRLGTVGRGRAVQVGYGAFGRVKAGHGRSGRVGFGKAVGVRLSMVRLGKAVQVRSVKAWRGRLSSGWVRRVAVRLGGQGLVG